MTTREDVEQRMWERDQAEALGWHEDRIEAELPHLFTDEEWEVMLSDPKFGYVCHMGHRLQEAERRYGGCFTCEAEAEAAMAAYEYEEWLATEEADPEPYCDYCESTGHTFRGCPRRDDDTNQEEPF